MKRRFVTGLTLLAVLMMFRVAGAQVNLLEEAIAFDEDQPALGSWLGNVSLPQSPEKRVFAAFTIDRTTDGTSVLKMTFLPAGALNKNGEQIEAQGSRLSFRLVGTGGEYHFQGDIADDGQRFSGQITLSAQEESTGEETSFEFARTPRPVDLPEPLAFTGELHIQDTSLGMSIVLGQTPGGNWVGQLDVPMQFLNAFPVINLTEHEGVITGELPVPGGASFEVTLDERRQHMAGVFKQSGLEMEIDFARDVNYAYQGIQRSQEPKSPFPYPSREITVEHLKTLDIIDAHNIGLIGHSEGGLIAPMLAGMTDDIAFMVLMAGPGVKGRVCSKCNAKCSSWPAGSAKARPAGRAPRLKR